MNKNDAIGPSSRLGESKLAKLKHENVTEY